MFGVTIGNLSTLETLIDEYIDYSKIRLKKIALEIQLTDYEKSWAVDQNDSLKHDVKIAREMMPKFEEIVQI